MPDSAGPHCFGVSGATVYLGRRHHDVPEVAAVRHLGLRGSTVSQGRWSTIIFSLAMHWRPVVSKDLPSQTR